MRGRGIFLLVLLGVTSFSGCLGDLLNAGADERGDAPVWERGYRWTSNLFFEEVTFDGRTGAEKSRDSSSLAVTRTVIQSEVPWRDTPAYWVQHLREGEEPGYQVLDQATLAPLAGDEEGFFVLPGCNEGSIVLDGIDTSFTGYRFPFEVGANWSSDALGVHTEHHVSAFERVATPVGDFDAFRVERSSGRSNDFEWTGWYAPDAQSFVRAEWRSEWTTAEDDLVQVAGRSELTDLHLERGPVDGVPSLFGFDHLWDEDWTNPADARFEHLHLVADREMPFNAADTDDHRITLGLSLENRSDEERGDFRVVGEVLPLEGILRHDERVEWRIGRNQTHIGSVVDMEIDPQDREWFAVSVVRMAESDLTEGRTCPSVRPWSWILAGFEENLAVHWEKTYHVESEGPVPRRVLLDEIEMGEDPFMVRMDRHVEPTGGWFAPDAGPVLVAPDGTEHDATHFDPEKGGVWKLYWQERGGTYEGSTVPLVPPHRGVVTVTVLY